MKKGLFLGITILPLMLFGQVGINTTTPQKSLHVNGSLQLVNELSVGGNDTLAGSSGEAGQVLKSNGPGVAPTWQNLAGVPNATGTVIAVDGEFIVAQEIVAQLTADFTTSASGANSIGNLSNKIVDNENKYSGNSSTNSFKVTTDGVYQITMNMQLSTANGSAPVIGVWDDTANRWVARVNDHFTAATGQLQTYTLLTSIPMLAANTYSFRLAPSNNSVTIKHLSSGGTGSGSVSQVALKRLR